jgi:hypothetical protein
MKPFYLWRWGGLLSMFTALLLVVAAILVFTVSDGGLGNSAAPTMYYVALAFLALALPALYGVQAVASRALGLVGFALAMVGAFLYSGPLYTLVNRTADLQNWSSIWAFSTDDVLSLGGALFLIGLGLLGFETMQAGVLPRLSGLPLLIGAALWLLAYLGLSFLLAPATLVTALGLLWMGWSLFAHHYMDLLPPQPEEP